MLQPHRVHSAPPSSSHMLLQGSTCKLLMSLCFQSGKKAHAELVAAYARGSANNINLHNLYESRPGECCSAREALSTHWLPTPLPPALESCLDLLDPSVPAHVAAMSNFHDTTHVHYRAICEFLSLPGSPIQFPVGFAPGHVLCVVTWADQGWGYQKGEIALGGDPNRISIAPAGHTMSTVESAITMCTTTGGMPSAIRYFSGGQRVPTPDTTAHPYVQRASHGGWLMRVLFKTGGGGGHELKVPSLVIISLPRFSMWELAATLWKVRKLMHSATEEQRLALLSGERAFLATLCDALPDELLLLVSSFMRPRDFAEWAMKLRDAARGVQSAA